ncbi:MAG: hypothetical protein ABJP87_06215 [Bauldia litoralis]|uniref:hypothetical protein n=1 Tax=Bauldia litoralis TaxID=665467 RepID=UPI00329A4C66
MGADDVSSRRPVMPGHGIVAGPGDAEASAVLDEIEHIRHTFHRRSLEEASIADRRRYALHHAFARLYLHTTRGWLDFARTSNSPAFFYGLIVIFFDIYRRDVHGNILAPGSSPTPRHWRPYFDVADNASKRPALYVRNVGLFHAARAHTRHDLEEALVVTYRSFVARREAVPCFEAVHAELLGAASGRLFSAAARDYLSPLDGHPGKPGRLSGRIGSAFAAARAADAMWLVHFQNWRRQAWMSAVGEITAPSV